MKTENQTSLAPALAPALGSVIERASKPEIGDTFRHGQFTIKIAYITNHRVHLAHYESGDFIRESSVEVERWPHHARATINHGAAFTPQNTQASDAKRSDR
jgi:hypothetical protein